MGVVIRRFSPRMKPTLAQAHVESVLATTFEELLHPPSVDESVLATEEHLDPPSAVQRLRLPSGAAAPPPLPIHASAAEQRRGRSPEPKPKPMQPDATDTHELVRAMIDLAAEGDTTPAPVPGHQASRDFGSTEASTLTNKRGSREFEDVDLRRRSHIASAPWAAAPRARMLSPDRGWSNPDEVGRPIYGAAYAIGEQPNLSSSRLVDIQMLKDAMRLDTLHAKGDMLEKQLREAMRLEALHAKGDKLEKAVRAKADILRDEVRAKAEQLRDKADILLDKARDLGPQLRDKADILLDEARAKGDAVLAASRARATKVIARTRSFVPQRESRAGFIDESAVPDPDVVLFADLVLARRGLPPRPGHDSSRHERASVDSMDDSDEDPQSDASDAAHGAEGARHGADGADWLHHATHGSTEAGAEGAASIGAAMGGGSGGPGGSGLAYSSALGSFCAEPSPDGALVQQLRRQVATLAAQLSATEEELRSAREISSEWSQCVRAMFQALLLNPRMLLKYELKMGKMMEKAIGKLEQIQAVRCVQRCYDGTRMACRLHATVACRWHVLAVIECDCPRLQLEPISSGRCARTPCHRYVKCSFPSIPSDAPQLQLLSWTSLEASQWTVSFAPSWRMEMCLEGRAALVPFKLLVRVSTMTIQGEMSLSFPSDMGHVLLSFAAMPKLEMAIDSEISLDVGVSLGLPVGRAAASLIRHEIHKWIASHAVAPHAMKIKRTPPTDPAAAAADAAATAAAAAPAAAQETSKPEETWSSWLLGGTTESAAAEPSAAGADAADSKADSRGAAGTHADAAHAAGGTENGESPSMSGVSDEDLRRAILAALVKHDNPSVGARDVGARAREVRKFRVGGVFSSGSS